VRSIADKVDSVEQWIDMAWPRMRKASRRSPGLLAQGQTGCGPASGAMWTRNWTLPR